MSLEIASDRSIGLTKTLTTFAGGSTGEWRILSSTAVCGEGLPPVARLTKTEDDKNASSQQWVLSGFTSNGRYTNRSEQDALVSIQRSLGRDFATRAALIPIRKNAQWWDMAQDERRRVVEAESRHISIGMEYLPAIARRLYHCRDIGGPFDFLTWFEYAPEQGPAFENLVERLRKTQEWSYVDREVDIRLAREV